MIGQQLAAVLLLSHEQGTQLLSLFGTQIPDLLHIDTEGEQKLLLEVNDDDVIVMQDSAEVMELLKTCADVVRPWLGFCYPHELIFSHLCIFSGLLIRTFIALP